MKNVVLFLILLIAGAVVYIYLAEPEWLDEIMGKEPGPAVEEPSSPGPSTSTRGSAPMAPAPTAPSRVKAKLTLPASDMDLFLSGEPVEPGSTLEIDPGTGTETELGSFAFREDHAAYPNGFINLDVIRSDYALKYAADQAIGRLAGHVRAAIPAARPMPASEVASHRQ
jgi:hypothetical protein